MKKIIIGLCVATVLSTIFISKSFNDNFFHPCYFGNVFIISILLLVQIFTIFFTVKKGNIELSFSKLDIAVVSLFVVEIVSLLVNHQSLNNPIFFNSSLLLLLYFVLKNNLRDGIISYVPLISWILLVAGSFELLYAGLQFLGVMKTQSLFPVIGNFGNPGLLSLFLTILFVWFLGVFLFEMSNKNLKIASSLFCGLSLLFIIFLFNRASWIVVAVCVPLLLHFRYGIFSFFTKFTIIKKVAVAFVLIVLVAVITPFLYHVKKDSSDGRLFIWQRTIEMIKDKPLTGVGFDAFEQNYNLYQANYFKNHPNDALNAHVADSVGFAFNEYLQTFAELGIVGLLAFLTVLILAVIPLAKAKPSNTFTNETVRVIAQIVIIAFIIFSFVAYPLRTIANSTLFYLFLAIAVSDASGLFSFKPTIKQWQIITIPFAVLVFGFLVYQINQMNSYKDWHKAMIAVQMGDRQGLQKMNELVPSLLHDNLFMFNYGTNLSLTKDYEKSIAVLEKVKPTLNNYNVYAYLGNNYEAINQLEKAVACFEMADNLIPSRIYTKFRLFILYDKLHDARAIPTAQKVLTMPTKGLSENVDALREKAKAYLESKKIQVLMKSN